METSLPAGEVDLPLGPAYTSFAWYAATSTEIYQFVDGLSARLREQGFTLIRSVHVPTYIAVPGCYQTQIWMQHPTLEYEQTLPIIAEQGRAQEASMGMRKFQQFQQQ